MLILLALPVIFAVAATHRYLAAFAPGNVLVRHVRVQEPRWRTGAMIAVIAVSLLVVMHVVAGAVANGAPGWLNLVVIVLAWDAIKIGCLTVGVIVRTAVGSARPFANRHRSRMRLRRIDRVSDDLSLFGDDEPSVPAAQVSAPAPIAHSQVNLLRKALDARGLTSLVDRQQAVEGAAGRGVPALRDLAHDEAIRVLSRLGASGQRGDRSVSLWESRDEDTWIDRL